jgi:hypothetical protein
MRELAFVTGGIFVVFQGDETGGVVKFDLIPSPKDLKHQSTFDAM